jgi:energy-coupling factor transport system ATP-binding protein
MDARIDGALAMVGLLDRRGERIERLSGGQKQRLALACVLVQQPEVLVLDEPTAQLDPAATAEVMALLGRLRAQQRHTLVIVEHRLDEVMPLVDRALVFSAAGELVADGPPRQVIRDHGDWLAEAGVWTPHVSELARGLAHGGIAVDPFPVTVDEAVTALRPHVERLEETPPSGPLPIAMERGRSNQVESGLPSLPQWGGGGGGVSPLPRTGRGVGGEGHLDSPLHRNGGESGVGSSTPLLQVRGLSFGYARASKPVLHDVSFSLGAGELVAVVGANGAGKSTLARLIAGIVRPPIGTVLIDGRDVSTLRADELARDVGYVFQYPEHQFVGQTVLDDVAYGLRRAGIAEAEAIERANAMLDDFGLLRLGPAHPFTLSHGEQRRLSVASMLILGQRLLLLDEPTFGQDQRNATMLLDKLEALASSGRAIVAVSHDMRLVAERAQRVLVLVDGRLAFDGAPADLFADADLLARARLTPPPLWELSARLGLRRPLSVRAAAGRPADQNGTLVAGPVGQRSFA